MTQILVAHEKHGGRYFDLNKGIGHVARALLQERLDMDCWYLDKYKAKATLALAGTNPKFTPWHFLQQRNRFEYERVEIVDLEVI